MKSPNIFLSVVAALLAVLLLFSQYKDLATWLMLITTAVLITILSLVRYLVELSVSSTNIMGLTRLGLAIVAIIGMFVANFSAAFSTIIPFSYYLLISILVTIQLILAGFPVLGLKSTESPQSGNPEKD